MVRSRSSGSIDRLWSYSPHALEGGVDRVIAAVRPGPLGDPNLFKEVIQDVLAPGQIQLSCDAHGLEDNVMRSFFEDRRSQRSSLERWLILVEASARADMPVDALKAFGRVRDWLEAVSPFDQQAMIFPLLVIDEIHSHAWESFPRRRKFRRTNPDGPLNLLERAEVVGLPNLVTNPYTLAWDLEVCLNRLRGTSI